MHIVLYLIVCVCLVGGAAVAEHDQAVQRSGEGLDDVCRLSFKARKVRVCPESLAAKPQEFD